MSRRKFEMHHYQVPPDATVRLIFAPGEAAQVDFGAGPMLQHPVGEVRRTWAFVMTLWFSRHQYVEFVWDQTVKYLKGNFLPLKTFRDLTDLNEQAARIGPACTERVEHLLADRIAERLRAAQGVLGLTKLYSAARLEAACARALAHGSPHYRTVKTILAGGHDLRAADTLAPSAVPHSGRFARDAASLFAAPKSIH